MVLTVSVEVEFKSDISTKRSLLRRVRSLAAPLSSGGGTGAPLPPVPALPVPVGG